MADNDDEIQMAIVMTINDIVNSGQFSSALAEIGSRKFFASLAVAAISAAAITSKPALKTAKYVLIAITFLSSQLNASLKEDSAAVSISALCF